MHSSWAPGLDQTSAESLQPGLLAAAHVKYVDLWQRGYILLDVDAERVRAAWYLFADASRRKAAEERLGQVCAVYAGEHCVRLEPDDEASAERTGHVI